MYSKKSLQDMMSFLDLMKRSFSETNDLAINISTHNIVLKAYVKNCQFQRALNYWNAVSSNLDGGEQEQGSVKANTITLSILMRVADGLNDMKFLSTLYTEARDNNMVCF